MANVYGMDYNNDNGMETTNFNLSSPQGGGASGSQSTPSKTRRATEEQTLIPVTVKMILDHSNNMLEDGREPHHIKLVAAIKDVNKASTAYMYTVEDGSGAIEVKEWTDEQDPVRKTKMREEAAVQHQYVRIIGKMQDYEGKPSVVAYSVRKLSSGNELTHHFLEVVHSLEKFKRASQIVGSPNGNGMMMNASSGVTSMTGIQMGNGNAGGGFNPGHNMPSASRPITNNENDDGNSPLKREILNFLSGGGDGGKNIQEFVAANSAKWDSGKIMEAVSDLSQDGLIYSTTDDNHYAYCS